MNSAKKRRRKQVTGGDQTQASLGPARPVMSSREGAVSVMWPDADARRWPDALRLRPIIGDVRWCSGAGVDAWQAEKDRTLGERRSCSTWHVRSSKTCSRTLLESTWLHSIVASGGASAHPIAGSLRGDASSDTGTPSQVVASVRPIVSGARVKKADHWDRAAPVASVKGLMRLVIVTCMSGHCDFSPMKG
jgi:hypothetical protein